MFITVLDLKQLNLIVPVCVLQVNLISGKIIRTLQTKLVEYKDQRLKLLNEVFQGIKAIKFSAWEDVFADKINTIREKEIKCFKVGF